jgi:hypothetical protein
MQRSNVLQLSFILTGLIFGILSIPSFLTMAAGIIFSFFGSGYNQTDFITYNIFIAFGIALQIIACWFLVIRSGKLASFFYKKTGLKKGIGIAGKPNELLHILLVAIGIYLLLVNIAPLLKSIFQSFKDKATAGVQNLYKVSLPVDWTTIVLNLALPLILLMFAKPVADYFSKYISEEEIMIKETDDNIDLIEPTEE